MNGGLLIGASHPANRFWTQHREGRPATDVVLLTLPSHRRLRFSPQTPPQESRNIDSLPQSQYNRGMVTELVINDALLERAFHLGGLNTENETVNVALREFIEKRAKEDLISLFNTVEYDEDYDWKQLRGRK